MVNARRTGPLAFVVMATAIAQAQPGQTPAPSSMIRGRILSAESGDPLRNARVSAGATVVLTDADGRFAIASAAARVTLTAGKTGFATTEVAAAAGQPIDVRLPRGAVITGRIYDRNGDPAVNAAVRIVRTEAPAVRSIVRTDDRGEYRTGSLPAGTYTVTGNAIAGGAMPSFAQLGPQAVHVDAGEERSGVDFTMPLAGPDGPVIIFGAGPANAATSDRPGSIRGRVVTTDDRPIPRAQVIAAPLRPTPGARPQATLSSSDGVFRFDDLTPTTYGVQANRSGYSPTVSAQSIVVSSGTPADATVTLEPDAVVAGIVVDDAGEPIQGVAVQALDVRYERGRRRLMPASDARYTDDHGAYRLFGLKRGSYVITAAIDGVQSIDMPGYARAYYPGTADPAQAQFITVEGGRAVGGANLWLPRAATARVSGRLFNSNGEPTGAGNLMLLPSQQSAAVTSVPMGARIGDDGTFDFPNVPPGQYVIQANRGRSGKSIEGEFGSLPVTVNGRDVTGLVLRTSAGSTIAGRITVVSSSNADPLALSQIEFGPVPVDYDASPSQFATADIQPDGSFGMRGINGPRRLTLLRAPAGWALREIRVHGIDVTDSAIRFGRREQSIADVEVVLTDRVSTIGGVVGDDRGRPAASAPVLVFPTDRGRRYPQSRFVAKAVTDANGEFATTGLPPGAYYAAAAARLPAGDDGWQDPQFLESLERQAVTVTVGDGAKVTVRLRAAAP